MKIYKISNNTRLLYGSIGFGAGFLGGYLIFENLIISFICAAFAFIYLLFISPSVEKEKQKRKYLIQFNDYLESLGTAVSAGQNANEAFMFACDEIKQLYGIKSLMYKSAKEIVLGRKNGKSLDVMLRKISKDSELSEMEVFADMFCAVQKKGGDTKRIINEAKNSIRKKIQIEEEIKIAITSAKNELNIMMLMPFIIIPSIRMFVSTDLETNAAADITVKIVAIILFIFSYLIGKRITNIKV